MRSVLTTCLVLLISSVALAQSGTLIVLNKSDHTVSLIDLRSKESLATVPTGVGPHEVAVSPDGKLAVVANYGTGPNPGSSLTVIDVPGKKRLKEIDLGEYKRPHGIVWLNDGRVAVTVEGNRALAIVDVAKGLVQDVVGTDQIVSHMVVATPGGDRAFVANIGSGSVTVIDLNEMKRLMNIETGAGAEGIDVSPNGHEIWVTNRSAHTLSVIDPLHLTILATLESKSFPIRVKITPDGKYALVSNAQSGDVAVFDTREKKEVRRIPMELSAVNEADQRLFGTQFGKSPVPVGILITPDGTHAFVANTQADIITVLDLTTWKIVDRLQAGREPDGLGYSPVSLKK